jgi:hypothetical protein
MGMRTIIAGNKNNPPINVTVETPIRTHDQKNTGIVLVKFALRSAAFPPTPLYYDARRRRFNPIAPDLCNLQTADKSAGFAGVRMAARRKLFAYAE